MSDIYINVNNEDADITNADLISSGDVDTVNVHFTFSEDWDEFPVKTMCVHAITQEEENKIGTNFIGITSEGLSVVPQGALTKAGRLFIAVVGENPDGKVLTSTWVTLKIRRGADFLVPDDEVDVFGRLMPAGGNKGDILVKSSDENFDYTWKPSSESLEAGLNISIVDQVISSNCFREVEELPEIGTAGVIYILDGAMYTWNNGEYIQFGKTYVAGDNITINGNTISATDTTYTAGDGIDITSGAVSTSASKVLNIAIADSESITYNSDSLLENAIGVSYDDVKDVYNTKKLNKIVIHPYVDSTEVEDDNQRCSILDIEYYETTSEDTEGVITSENYEMIFNHITDDANSLVNIYSLIITKNFVDTTFANYTVSIELKPYTNDIYALKKYYGNENINLGNNNGVPANTYATGSIWNQATGTGNTINGQYNEVFGNNNNISGTYNNAIGYGLYVNGQFNVAFGPVMPEAKKLQGMCNIVIAYGNDVNGNENAVFGNNNKVRGDSHLIAGHGHDVQGYNNLVTGEYSTVNGSDNAVFGINYGTIQGSSNLVNGYYTYVKPLGSGSGSTSQHNIIGGAYHTVSGSNNLVIGEQTTNDSFTFPDDTEATVFDHVKGYDNIYSSFLGAITGNHNILTGSQSKIYGDKNAIFGDHQQVKGAYNIITGSGGDAGFVGNHNLGIISGSYSTINGAEFSTVVSGYCNAENIRYADINAFYSNFKNAQYITAHGYGLKFTGILDENDYYTNPNGLTIIGQWNEDGNDRNDYVFVVGDGIDDTHRNNVFTISKDGQVTCTINNKKHTVFGSSCVTDTLPQAGQEDTLYVLTDTSQSTTTVSGLYIWDGQAYVSISTGGGGGGSYIAGNNIDITGNVISADIIEPIATFTLTPTGTTPAYTVSCDTTYSELISRYNNDKLKTQLDVESNTGHNVINITRFDYRNGVAKFYFEYTEDDYLYVYEITKTGNPSADTYSYDIISTRVQPKLTAGTNITIDNTDPANPVINATGGSGGSYTAGDGIDITNNVISADVVECNVIYNAVNNVLTIPMTRIEFADLLKNHTVCFTVSITNQDGSIVYSKITNAQYYFTYHGTADFSLKLFIYDMSETDTIQVISATNVVLSIPYGELQTMSATMSTLEIQKKLTAGTGISIDPTTNTISLDLSQAEGGGF